MIIDFSVKNFRSIREEQRLSFVANNRDATVPEAIIDPKLAGAEFAKLRLLKGLVLYGANAAGKTNVLKGLGFLAHMVENSATDLDEGDNTGVEPFLFDDTTPGEPSEFVLRFVVEGIRYHFILVLNEKRILFESLSAFPKGREQVWYEREWDDDLEAYTWEPARPTDYKRDPNLVKYTRDNALYLSTAVKFNDEQLKPIYLWFKDKVCMLRLNSDFPPLSPNYTAKQVMDDPNKRARVTRLLQHADLGILSAKASERELSRDDFPGQIPDEVLDQILKQKHVRITLGHRGSDDREYVLEWEDESSGTQKFFALSGPWLNILENGYFAGLDEIESSMHPLMVRALLNLVFSEETNRKGAQLLFTTHNPLLLDTGLIRRDQIWFADKDDGGGTFLYPLTDYQPRKKESLVRGYMAGRYGAVPFIPGGLLGEESEAETTDREAVLDGEA